MKRCRQNPTVHPGAAVEFQLTPAQHWSGRGLSDRNRTLWGGWAVMGADFHWYFTGDTACRYQGGGADSGGRIFLLPVGGTRELPRRGVKSIV
jgi:L-ascorbate metabolism protein UlaG (beta-lactamase superfamily)